MTIPASTGRDLGVGLRVRLSPLAPAPLRPVATDGGLKPFRTSKRAEDTAVGCRANAAADLVRAAASGSEYFRGRLEHSAAVWAARAELLDRLAMKWEQRLTGTPQ